MRRRLFRTPLHRIASALAALALVVLGAHHEPHGAGPTGPDLSAYAMPGGVMPELCIAVETGAPEAAQPCLLCLLAAAALPAAPPSGPGPRLARAARRGTRPPVRAGPTQPPLGCPAVRPRDPPAPTLTV